MRDQSVATAAGEDAVRVRQFFDQWHVYKRVVALNYLHHREAYAALAEALDRFDRPFSFLDLGAGDAAWTSRILQGRPLVRYEAVDLSPVALLGLALAVSILANYALVFGNLGAPAGVPVAFHQGTPTTRGALLGTGTTTMPLLPGQSEVIELSGVALMGEPPYAFVVFADDDGTGSGGIVLECDEDDNAGSIADLDCDILF